MNAPRRVGHASMLLSLSFAGTLLGQNAPDIVRDGAFGFPQNAASVLCSTESLRVSAANDDTYLYVQAVLFDDSAPTLGKAANGHQIGDNSVLVVDTNADGKPTYNADRNFHLSPWPEIPGLYFTVMTGKGATSFLQENSSGRGGISYIKAADGKTVRVDSYLIPLDEIGCKPGGAVRVLYCGKSYGPDVTVNSAGFTSEKPYHASSIPFSQFHEVKLGAGRPAIDVKAVPEDRVPGAMAKAINPPKPAVGAAAPELGKAAWLNWKDAQPPTLAGLKGRVVILDFWATWCAPCVAGIPDMNSLHDKLGPQGLVILSLTAQDQKTLESFLEKHTMKYAVATGSQDYLPYGVGQFPTAYIIARDGTIAWVGIPDGDDFEKKLAEELAKN